MELHLSRRVALGVAAVVCPSVMGASPCSTAGLSCGWWSVNVDAVVSVQRAAAMSTAGSVSWCCSCHDDSCSSRPRSASVCPPVVDGCSSVTSTCPPTTHVRYLSTSCRRSYPSTLTSESCRRCVDTKQVNVDLSSCRGCGPSCSRRTFATATSPL